MIGDQTQVVGPVLQVLIGVAMLIGTLCTIALTWKKLMTNPPLPPGQEFVQRSEVAEMFAKFKSEIVPTHMDLLKRIDELTKAMNDLAREHAKAMSELNKEIAILVDRAERGDGTNRTRRTGDNQGDL